jgi:2-dehydro-3-deoxygluconokinase
LTAVAAFDVITAGEAMALFAAEQPGPLEQADTFRRRTAGAELNVAIGLARLGLRVAYLGRLGDDSFGRGIAAVLDREGIDRSRVAFDRERPTGFMLKARSDDGRDPSIEYFRRGSAASATGVADLPDDIGTIARHLHLTGIFVAVSASARACVFELAARAKAAGCTISFDPNLRPALWPSPAAMVETLDALAAFADWVLPGLDEGRLLTGRDAAPAIAEHYLRRGARGVVVKLGATGAHWATARECGDAAGVPVAKVVDTVGAGDGFAVGVVSALLEGLPLAEAAARGNRIGARAVQFPGDCDGLPTRRQLDAMVAD